MARACAVLALNHAFISSMPPSCRSFDGCAACGAETRTAAAISAAASRTRRNDRVIVVDSTARHQVMPMSGQYSGTSSSRITAVTTERIAPTFSMSLLVKYPYE